MSIAYYSGMITPLISDMMPEESDSVKLERSMTAMVVFGFGEVFGGLIIGQVIDAKGSRFVAVLNTLIVLLMSSVTLLFIGLYEFSWLAFLVTFLWGFQDATVNTHCFEMLGFEFENNYEPYSIFNLLQAAGACAFLMLETFVDSQPKYFAYTCAVGLFGLVSCGSTYFFKFKTPSKGLSV